jgi:hypothetical protein
MSNRWKDGRVAYILGIQLRDIFRLEQPHITLFCTAVFFSQIYRFFLAELVVAG